MLRRLYQEETTNSREQPGKNAKKRGKKRKECKRACRVPLETKFMGCR